MFPLHSVCYPHRAENECERGESRKASRVTFNTMSANMKLCVYDPTEARKQMREERILQEIEDIWVEEKKMIKNMDEKCNCLRNHVDSLYEIAGAMDSTHKSATIAGALGAGLSVTGGLVALSGAALAPFTGGASLVTTVGVGGSFLGGFTRIVGGVKEKLDNTNTNNKLDEILKSCEQNLQALVDNYNKVQEKNHELEKVKLKMKGYYEAVEKLKEILSGHEPAQNSAMSKVVVENLSHGVSQVITREVAKEVAMEMSKQSTSYLSYEAIKEFFTFSSREVSKRWYQDVARTSSMASGAAAAVFLPFDAHELYKEANHLNQGAKSEFAEEIRNVARELEALISQLAYLL